MTGKIKNGDKCSKRSTKKLKKYIQRKDKGKKTKMETSTTDLVIQQKMFHLI